MAWSDYAPGCIQTVPGVGGQPATEIPTLKCFEAVFARILSITLSLAGVALFIMLVVGGFKYLTSGGDPETAAGAKKTMTYAILGLALMIGAYLIFRILEFFLGINLTNFVIPDNT